MADVLPDQIIAHGVDQVALFQITEPPQQFRHLQRHRGLAGARRAGEAHVQVRPRRLKPEPLPDPVHQQQRGDFLDLLLDRNQPDEFGVQLGEDVIDARGRALVGQGDRGIRVQYCRRAVGREPRPGPDGSAPCWPLPSVTVTLVRAGREPGRSTLVRLGPGVLEQCHHHGAEQDAADDDGGGEVRQVRPAQRQGDHDAQQHHANFEISYSKTHHGEKEGSQRICRRSSGVRTRPSRSQARSPSSPSRSRIREINPLSATGAS